MSAPNLSALEVQMQGAPRAIAEFAISELTACWARPVTPLQRAVLADEIRTSRRLALSLRDEMDAAYGVPSAAKQESYAAYLDDIDLLIELADIHSGKSPRLPLRVVK